MVSAVAFLSGVILLAADYVASANPEVRRASPVQWRTWSEHAAVIAIADAITWAVAVFSANWKALAGNSAIAAIALAYVLFGVHWQNEWLTFLPFWALMAWRLWKANLLSRGSLSGTAVILFSIAAVSLVFAIVFVSENEPEYPTWRQLVGPGELFPSEAAVTQAGIDWRVESERWYAEHGKTLLGFVYAQLAVATGAALLTIFLAGRGFFYRRRKTSSSPG